MTKRSRPRRPPSLNLYFSSPDTSRPGTPSPDQNGFSIIRDHDNTDDRPDSGEMEFISSGPYCFKRPTLTEVLSNTAPAPYTLSAFMAYLSQNHCLETLEFTMDANRYRKHYHTIANKCPADPKDRAYVRKLWQKILDAYIVPNGPREVNLPCTIRDQILSIPNHSKPPPPEALDPAGDIIKELMQESVVVPFLNECNKSQVLLSESGSWLRNSSDESVHLGGSLDERLLHREPSPPSPVGCMRSSFTSGISEHGHGNPSPFSADLGWHSRQDSHMTHAPSSWTSNCSGDSMVLVDDSGSSTPNWGTPMTPPMTPPTSEAVPIGSSGSPRRVGEKPEKAWRRMTVGLGRGLGWGRKKPESASYW